MRALSGSRRVGLGGPSRERRLGPVCAVALRCELDRIVAVVDDFGQAEVSNFDLKSVLTLWYAGYSMVCWVLYGMLGTQGNDAKRQAAAQ